jgi:alanyl aminopeptidase
MTTSRSGHHRLPAGLRPERYRLRLRLDPTSDNYAGRVEIDVLNTGSTPAREVALHAEALDFDAAALVVDGARREVTPVLGPNGALTVLCEPPLPPGAAATLHLSFRGEMTEVPEGLYRVQENDAWYAFTQFEPLSARRCFPCFDEPDFKAAFSVQLEVPRGLVALSNAPTMRIDAFTDFDVHHFAETAPIATYLVAFAVGTFDVVEANPQPGDLEVVPLRVVTTRGRGHLAQYALERTPRILDALSRWFGLPYPYEKLDLVGVPNFAAGAMENVGLVTFRERLVLLDADEAPANDRLWAQVVIAHELAHMWFGNLVTMRWWDDLWLNEAFATWMEMDCVAQVDPGLDADVEAVAETLRVMDHDALTEARSIRQPIVDGGDVLNAFDGITYSKGAGVVRMVEAWLGRDAFREGVRAYLREHAHGNAETADLLRALARVSGQPVDEVLRTWLDQPGLPVVTARLSPDGLSVDLEQRRYLPDDAPSEAWWHIPMGLRFGTADGAVHSTTVLLTTRRARFPLPTAVPATWLHPNADEAGYYHWAVDAAALRGLIGPQRAALTTSERLGLVEHLGALFESGAVGVEDYLRALDALATDTHRLVLAALCSALRKLQRLFVGPAQQPDFARWVRRLLDPHLVRLGSRPRPEDDSAERLLRPLIVQTLAEADPEHAVHAELRDLAETLLRDSTGGDPELAQSALVVAALHGDAAYFEAVAAALRHAPTPAHRAAALAAMGHAPTPTLARSALDLFLTDTLRAQDFFGLVRSTRRLDTVQDAVWSWLDAHWDAVAAKLGDEACAHLPSLAAGTHRVELATRVERFFAVPSRRKPGLERHLRQVLEDIGRRARLHDRVVLEFQRLLPTL